MRPFCALAGEGLGDRVLRLCGGAGLGVEHQRARAALGEHLHDAAAHGAAAGDAGDEIAAGDVEHGAVILGNIIRRRQKEEQREEESLMKHCGAELGNPCRCAAVAGRRRPFRPSASRRSSRQADHPDLPWPAGGSTDTHLRAVRADRREVPRPERRDREQARRRRHARARHMAKIAAPDGYTLSQLPVGAFRIPHMQKVDWNPLKDFTYIIGITGYTFGVVVKADSQFKTLQGRDRLRQGQPGQVLLRLDRQRHLAAPADGGGGGEDRACSCCTCRSRATPIPRRR